MSFDNPMGDYMPTGEYEPDQKNISIEYLKLLKHGVYMVAGCDSNTRGNDPKLSSIGNFKKGVIDGLFELPEFAESIIKNPTLLNEIKEKLQSVDLAKQMKEMFTSYETPYDAGKTGVNTILTLLGIGGLLKTGARVAQTTAKRVGVRAGKQLDNIQPIVIGDALVAGNGYHKQLRIYNTAKRVEDALKSPTLKSALTLGVDPLLTRMTNLAKIMPAIGPTIIQYENLIKRASDLMKKYPNLDDIAVVGVALGSISKDLPNLFDRTKYQYGLTKDVGVQRIIESQTAIEMESIVKTAFEKIPNSILKSIFK